MFLHSLLAVHCCKHTLIFVYLLLSFSNKSQRFYNDNKFSDIFLMLVSLNCEYCYNIVTISFPVLALRILTEASSATYRYTRKHTDLVL